MTRRCPLFLCTCLLLALPLLARSQATGMITVEQRPAPGFSVLGTWVLLKPDGTRTETNTATHSYADARTGSYLLNVLPPSGMEATITLTTDGQSAIINKPQTSFLLNEGGTVNLSINHALALSGKVSVDSSPQGLPYTLSGPDGATYTGNTPGFFDPMPVGLYSVTLDPIPGCVTPAPQSGRLTKDSRVILSVDIDCDNLSDLTQQQTEEKRFRFVTATVDGREVIFEDLPSDQWYAAPIRKALDAKVMSGYRNADGAPTGRFGPGDPVTIAELAKIAHRIAGIHEAGTIDPPDNERARGTWFAPFVASAERLDWLIFLNRRIDPLRPATRAEVVATFLQVLNIKRDWPTGTMFTDVTRTMPYADCIETAAAAKLVEGRKDDKGVPTGTFDPAAPINRAEMAKMISKAIELFGQNTPNFQPE